MRSLVLLSARQFLRLQDRSTFIHDTGPMQYGLIGQACWRVGPVNR